MSTAATAAWPRQDHVTMRSLRLRSGSARRSGIVFSNSTSLLVTFTSRAYSTGNWSPSECFSTSAWRAPTFC